MDALEPTMRQDSAIALDTVFEGDKDVVVGSAVIETKRRELQTRPSANGK